MRLIVLSSVFLALSSAFLLYALNTETRQLEERVQARERMLASAKSDVAVLKAERAHLARPDRIEPHARAAGFVPPRPAQFADAIAAPATALNAD